MNVHFVLPTINQLAVSFFRMTMKSLSINTGSSNVIFGDSTVTDFLCDVDTAVVVVVTSVTGSSFSLELFTKKAEKMMEPDLQFSSFTVLSTSLLFMMVWRSRVTLPIGESLPMSSSNTCDIISLTPAKTMITRTDK